MDFALQGLRAYFPDFCTDLVIVLKSRRCGPRPARFEESLVVREERVVFGRFRIREVFVLLYRERVLRIRDFRLAISIVLGEIRQFFFNNSIFVFIFWVVIISKIRF